MTKMTSFYQDCLWVYNAEIFLWAPITQLHHISRIMLKSGLTILIWAPEVPFLLPPKWLDGVVLANLGVPEMALFKQVPGGQVPDHI